MVDDHPSTRGSAGRWLDRLTTALERLLPS